MPRVWLNDHFCNIQDAKVSVLDRGFLYGDGIYEIIPVYQGHPLQTDLHIDRLLNGLAEIRINDSLGRAGWIELVDNLLNENKAGDVSVYIQVTRGTPSYRDHAFPDDIPPTVFAMCSPLPQLSKELIEKGVSVITRPDSRWARCDIKAISLLANVLLRQQAVDDGAAETILYDGERVTEGSASSVFAVTDSIIKTPPNTTAILPGTTRELILHLARQSNMEAVESEISLTELRNADEVWLCSSLRELLPVCMLDGNPVGSGTPGPLFKTLHASYQEHKRSLR
ncbi:MAG: D-amino acid aminotransferase [Gammaproteobacteria bacterium]|nr:D-amino acid aminotransferase [Gammaproteobacteria bacterium]